MNNPRNRNIENYKVIPANPSLVITCSGSTTIFVVSIVGVSGSALRLLKKIKECTCCVSREFQNLENNIYNRAAWE